MDLPGSHRHDGVADSGAINGIVGIYLVWFPVNSISCFYWLFLATGKLECDSVVMIPVWLGFGLWGVISGQGGIAYFAHLGRFAAGSTLAAWLTCRRIAISTSYEVGLFEYPNWPTSGDRRGHHDGGTGTAAAGWPRETPDRPDSRKLMITCADCGASQRAPPALAGRLIRCPRCNAARSAPVRERADV